VPLFLFKKTVYYEKWVGMPWRLDMTEQHLSLIERLSRDLNLPMIEIFRRALEMYAEKVYNKEELDDMGV
jgi:hypothetical protein